MSGCSLHVTDGCCLVEHHLERVKAAGGCGEVLRGHAEQALVGAVALRGAYLHEACLGGATDGANAHVRILHTVDGLSGIDGLLL